MTYILLSFRIIFWCVYLSLTSIDCEYRHGWLTLIRTLVWRGLNRVKGSLINSLKLRDVQLNVSDVLKNTKETDNGIIKALEKRYTHYIVHKITDIFLSMIELLRDAGQSLV